MMKQEIDLQSSVYDLCRQYPQLQPLLVSIGFEGLKNAALLQTVGRTMTLTKGAKMMKIPLDEVIEKLTLAGFSVTGHEGE